jgi:hypothetical protein
MREVPDLPPRTVLSSEAGVATCRRLDQTVLHHRSDQQRSAALCFTALNVIVLMAPAALHRLSFGGQDSEAFLHLGSAL